MDLYFTFLQRILVFVYVFSCKQECCICGWIGILKNHYFERFFKRIKYSEYKFKVNENPSYIVTVTKMIKEGENIPYTHNKKVFPKGGTIS